LTRVATGIQQGLLVESRPRGIDPLAAEQLGLDGKDIIGSLMRVIMVFSAVLITRSPRFGW
jgi:hypothetical protein